MSAEKEITASGAKPSFCHPSRKIKAHGLCGSCYDKKLKKENPKYKAAQLSNTTKWARANPERMSKIQSDRVIRDKAQPDYKIKQRNKTLKKYGLTQELYLELLGQQGNCCALCFRVPKLTRFHVDHNPMGTFKDVRGILCHQCNWYLGVVDNDPSILERIKLYREKK